MQLQEIFDFIETLTSGDNFFERYDVIRHSNTALSSIFSFIVNRTQDFYIKETDSLIITSDSQDARSIVTLPSDFYLFRYLYYQNADSEFCEIPRGMSKDKFENSDIFCYLQNPKLYILNSAASSDLILEYVYKPAKITDTENFEIDIPLAAETFLKWCVARNMKIQDSEAENILLSTYEESKALLIESLANVKINYQRNYQDFENYY